MSDHCSVIAISFFYVLVIIVTVINSQLVIEEFRFVFFVFLSMKIVNTVKEKLNLQEQTTFEELELNTFSLLVFSIIEKNTNIDEFLLPFY